MLETSATTPRDGAGAASTPDRASRHRKKAEAVAASVDENTTAEFGPQQSFQSEPAPHSVSGDEPAASDTSLPDHASSPGGEIELKLLVDADRLADFNEADVIAAN